MKLNEVIQKVQSTNWTEINNFRVEISPNNAAFAGMTGFPLNDKSFKEQIDISLISINTPQYSNQEIAEFFGNMWRYHVGRDELFKFEITFRDYDQMSLYKKFIKAYNKSKYQYFDNITFTIQVYNCDNKFVSESLLFKTDKAIIQSVSQLQFSHKTQNEIAEFTVSFACNTPGI